MLILLFIVSVILCYGFVRLSNTEKSKIDETDEDYALFSVFSLFIAAVIFIIILFSIHKVCKLSVIDEKIAMYEEENIKIEDQLDIVVSKYMDYESGVFKESKAESSITLISLYPELKADTLVQSQIDTYTQNNKQMKTLKEQKINGKVDLWWLYFGH